MLYANDIGLTSIRCRSLLVPHRAISEVLARSVRPLIFENDDTTYQYSRRGSCCLIGYNKEHLIVFTAHQQHGFEPDTIRVIHGFYGGPSVTVDYFFVVKSDSGDEEFDDLRALKVATAHYSPQDLKDFFPLADHLPPIQRAKLLIAVGCPTNKGAIDYDPGHIHVGTIPTCLLI